MPSGIKLACKYTNSPTSLISVFIKGGPRYENKLTQGYSHLLEHLILNNKAFRHSKVDGYTSKEMIMLQFGQKQNETINTLKSIMDVLNGKRFYKNFSQKMIDNEKQVIMDEYKETGCKKEEEIVKVDSNLPNSYKLPILGNFKTIDNFNLKTLRHVFNQIIKPFKIAVLVDSNLSDKHVATYLHKATDNKMIKTVGGFENYEFVKYFLLQEILNGEKELISYLPYKNFGIVFLRECIGSQEISEDMLKIGKLNLIKKLLVRSSNKPDIIDDFGYSLLYFSHLPSYSDLIRKVNDINLKCINQTKNNLMK